MLGSIKHAMRSPAHQPSRIIMVEKPMHNLIDLYLNRIACTPRWEKTK